MGLCAMKPHYFMRKTERKCSRNRNNYVLVLLVEIKRQVLICSISHKQYCPLEKWRKFKYFLLIYLLEDEVRFSLKLSFNIIQDILFL